MQLIEEYIYLGPNRRAERPVIEQLIHFEQAELAVIAHGKADLHSDFDTLLRQAGMAPAPGSPALFAPEAEPGGYFCELYVRAAISLQQCTGHRVAIRQALPSTGEAGWRTLFEYEEREVGIAAGNLALSILQCLFGLAAEEPGSEADRSGDICRNVREFRQFAAPRALPWDTLMIIDAAQRADVPAFKLDRFPFEPPAGDFRIRENSALKLGHACRQHVIDGTFCVDRSHDCRHLLRDREQVYRFIRQQGLPVPEVDPDSKNCSTLGRALRSARRIGYPLVLKPILKANGRGIALALVDEAGVTSAYENARVLGRRVVLERHVPGQTHRVIIANNQLIAVVREGNNREHPIDVTGLAHPSLARDCLRLCRSLTAGVLVLTVISTDISRSLDESGAAVVDLDIAPELDRFLPRESPIHRLVADQFVNWLFPDPTNARIPIVVVTGTNGKTTTTRMVHAIMAASGYKPGMACSDGVYDSDTRLLREGDLAGSTGHYQLLVDSAIDSAVLETARGAVADSGLCFDRSSIGICLNVSSDHLGDKGIDTLEQMAELKRSIVASAKDAVILNADDALCVAMAPFPATERLGLVSTRQSWLELRAAHPQCSFFAVQELVDGLSWLVIYSGDQRIEVLPMREIPATFDGRATFNVSNTLHATLACHLVGLSLKNLRSGLKAFRMGFENTPGRLNFYEHLPFRVLVDYAHNPDGVARLCEFVDRLDVSGSKFIVLSAAGYNPDELIRGNALAAAGYFDYYICFNYLRNIASEHFHVPEVLRHGLVAAGVPQERITVVDRGMDALELALNRVRPGDLVVLLAGHSDRKEIRARLLSAPAEPPRVAPQGQTTLAAASGPEF